MYKYKIYSVFISLILSCGMTHEVYADILCSLGKNVVIVKRANKCPKGYSPVSIGTIKDYKKLPGFVGTQGTQGPMGPQGDQGATGPAGLAGSIDPKFCYSKKTTKALSEYPSAYQLTNVSVTPTQTYHVRNVTLSCDAPNHFLHFAEVNPTFSRAISNSRALFSTLEDSTCTTSEDNASETCTQRFPNGFRYYVSDSFPALSNFKPITIVSIICCASN